LVGAADIALPPPVIARNCRGGRALSHHWLCCACGARARKRAQFATLDERMLRDIGVERSDVEREINQPFWRK